MSPAEPDKAPPHPRGAGPSDARPRRLPVWASLLFAALFVAFLLWRQACG